MPFMALVIIASGVVAGGRLGRFAGLRLRMAWLIVAALAAQVLITEVTTRAPRPLDVSLHLASYVAAGVALWANRRIPGILLIGLGTLLNSGVIALNGGTLPARVAALRQAGLPVHPPGFQNSGVVHHPILAWLGDTMATPSWLPLRNVISVGDLTILVGTAVLVHCVTGSRLCALGRTLRTARPGVRSPGGSPAPSR